MTDASPVRLRFDTFELDEGNVRLTRDRQPVTLTPRAFAVLCELARHPGELVTKDALLDSVWGHQHVSESVLKTIISQLRSALSDDARQPRYIETVSRFGYRFIAATGAAPAVVAQGPESPAGADRLVGREAALARLHECWQRTLVGERQLVWITGDAGVGKTTLIEAFARDLPPEVSVFGRCVEHFGSGEPYLPLLEALNEHCRREPEVVGIMRAVAPTWLVQMPWLISEEDRTALHRELAGTHPDRMVRELGEMMKRYTANKPLLLVIEDLHWSDLGTLRMMEHFARQPRNFRFMWVASFRLTQVITEDHPLKELRQELRLHRLCDEIVLDPFSEDECNTYLHSRLPDLTFSEDFVRRLHAHTDGLPLFIANVADTLLSGSAGGVLDAAAWSEEVSNLPLPESLAGVLGKQVARLSPDECSLLEAAAVCGTEFRTGMAAAMLGREVGAVHQQCDELVRRELWLNHVALIDLVDGGFDASYAFRHALYRHVFYQRIPATQRVQYHRAAAAWIRNERAAGEYISAAELASHLERGREMVAAIEAYAEGARYALTHFAPKDAESLAARAQSLIGHCRDERHRQELELTVAAHSGIAASLLYGVGAEEARAPFERVRALCDQLPPDPKRAMALNGLGWVYFTRGEFDESLQLAKRLLDIAARFDDLALHVYGSNLRGVTSVWLGELQAATESLQSGIERCIGSEGRLPLGSFVIDPEVSMRGNIAVPLADQGFFDQSLEHLRLARERADRIGQPIARMLAHWATCQVYLRMDEPEHVLAHAGTIAEVVESAMLAHGEGPSLWMRGWASARLGDPGAGHRDIVNGYERHTRLGMFAGCTEVLAMAAEALILAGDLAGATRQLEDGFGLADRIGERLALPRLLLHRGQIAARKGDLVAAEISLRQGLAEARRQQARDAELYLLVALHDLGVARSDDAAELFAACDGRREGRGTPLCRRALSLVVPAA